MRRQAMMLALAVACALGALAGMAGPEARASQVDCAPRPRVAVSAAIVGGGRLDVTVTAGSGSLTGLLFGPGTGRAGILANAVVDVVGGPTGQATPFGYTPPPGAVSVSFRVWRGEGL